MEHDLARLSAAGPESRLVGLEQAIWAKVEALNRLRRIERATSRVQLVALIVGLLASITVGVIIAAPPSPRRALIQMSAVAADLAPSTLLDPSR